MIRSASFSKPNPHHPQRNEDALLEDKKNLLFAVFNRIRARKGGYDSSQIAKENLKTLAGSIKSREDLKKIIQDIHQQIRKKGTSKNTPGKMGTTATCLKINPQETKSYYVQLGDSRVYQYSKDKLKK